MKFRFPIVIIDEDFRSENTSGLGIRALAQAIESEGYEVMGVTSYGDLSQFAQQQSRASAFILSIDDEEFTPGPDLDPAVVNLRSFIDEVRRERRAVDVLSDVVAAELIHQLPVSLGLILGRESTRDSQYKNQSEKAHEGQFSLNGFIFCNWNCAASEFRKISACPESSA
jgi:hypothetical protein